MGDVLDRLRRVQNGEGWQDLPPKSREPIKGARCPNCGKDTLDEVGLWIDECRSCGFIEVCEG